MNSSSNAELNSVHVPPLCFASLFLIGAVNRIELSLFTSGGKSGGSRIEFSNGKGYILGIGRNFSKLTTPIEFDQLSVILIHLSFALILAQA